MKDPAIGPVGGHGVLEVRRRATCAERVPDTGAAEIAMTAEGDQDHESADGPAGALPANDAGMPAVMK